MVAVQRPTNCRGQPLIMIGKTYREHGAPVLVLVRWEATQAISLLSHPRSRKPKPWLPQTLDEGPPHIGDRNFVRRGQFALRPRSWSSPRFHNGPDHAAEKLPLLLRH